MSALAGKLLSAQRLGQESLGRRRERAEKVRAFVQERGAEAVDINDCLDLVDELCPEEQP